jgi:hypothetical protein
MNLSDVYDDSKLGVLSQNLTTNLFKAKLRYGSKEQVRDGTSNYMKTTIKGFDPKDKICQMK